MKAHRISIKLWFTADNLELEEFVPVFHAWIRERKLEDEVMIDVADYAHVEEGPGVLLVCHEGHYVIERRGDRWALCYHRKRGGESDDLEARLAVPLRRLVTAARLLEGAPELGGKLHFDTETIDVEIRSRLHVENDTASRTRLLPVLKAALARELEVDGLELEPSAEDPRAPFSVRARLAAARPLDQLVA
jgi:hypothetical protein